ncbi:hypothetical protein H8356DRAFT_1719349 [Neocallimastix lanati (nom. inval.)]|uniref:Rho GTPase activation protein n=1 Tax=Neocallimastix californiae TaxID=1754190 RepID=A0A1Y2EZV6_9FUNG|nr:hypothetical protein H8356DRAFT_1719349 [Neocallimastix sp. JGI-2020a]ORY77162.1 hypothetical protein LY90DRAFT_102344 [Neocallimastix californiae]|eukprot:ORY77162.1 hypothetical protein LY90DRAFT_102344 [Neocallimastix californiae]
MTELMYDYILESINKCKDFVKFLQKRQQIEIEYSKALVRLCQSYQQGGDIIEENTSDVHKFLANNSLWRGFQSVVKITEQIAQSHKKFTITLKMSITDPFIENISNMESHLQSQMNDSNEHTKNLQEAYTELKKAKQTYQENSNVVNDLINVRAKASSMNNFKEKDEEKWKIKYDQAVEKANYSNECVKYCEEICKNAQEHFYHSLLPALKENIREDEEERCASVKKALQKATYLEHCHIQDYINELNSMSTRLNEIDIEDDIENFVDNYMQDDKEKSSVVSVRSLVDPQMTGRMFVQRGDETGQWKSKYFVLMKKFNRLYCFDNEDSERQRDTIDLNSSSIHTLDYSYFLKKNCFQIITTFPNPLILSNSQNSSTSNDHIKNKSPYQVLIYYFTMDSVSEYNKWVSQLTDTAHCCTRCYNTKYMLKKYSGTCNKHTFEEFRVKYDNVGSNEDDNNSLIEKKLGLINNACSTEGETNNKNSYEIVKRKDSVPLDSPTLTLVEEIKPNKRKLSLSNSNPNFQFQIRRNLIVSILEARELVTPDKKKNIEPYVVVLLNDIKKAKTSIKSGSEPFWREEFKFNNISLCAKRIQIIIINHQRLQKDSEIGFTVIHFKNLVNKQKTEKWYDVLSLYNTNQPSGSYGSIRIGIQINNKYLLPIYEYQDLLKILIEPSLTCIRILGTSIQQREEFSKCFLNIMIDCNKELEGIKILTQYEIDVTEDQNIIFRGNSITTKTIDQYMKTIGHQYLENTIGHVINQVYSSKDSCEVDPTKVEKNDDIKKHWKKLLEYVCKIWDAIKKSADNCPKKLKYIFSQIKCQTSLKFANPNVQYSAISGFIFLRFFCPAILSPKLFGLQYDHPDPVTARTLTLIAKIIQNLANLSEFEKKEPHMAYCNTFINKHMHEMKDFINSISNYDVERDGEIEEETTEKIDLQEELETMYGYFHDNMEILKRPENITEPKINQIISIIESIDNIHFQYIQRFFENSSNENNYYVDELLNEEYKIEQELINAKAEKESMTSPTDVIKEDYFPTSGQKSNRNKENRYSMNLLPSIDKINTVDNNENIKNSLYLIGHKKSLSDEQNAHEQSLIDIVKAITNSMYNSRNLTYLRDEGSEWLDLSKAGNDDIPSRNINYNGDDDIDNLSEYEDFLDFGSSTDFYLSGKEKDKRYGTQKIRNKSIVHKYNSEEILNAKDTKDTSSIVSRNTTFDFLNYYNINELENKNENEESRKELKNAFDNIVNSEQHFQGNSSNKSTKSIGISKAASLRRKLSNFHFVNSSSSNNQ